ncbi:hypothetical protein [Hoyosella altamirensis]|uniref:Antitoxin (DNA-binding transcriptional repressor) of toxin-antitoxin stability system n=1 Tax=Hoyosella altamirensis TaxID=616997 RepID=A0A839RKB5_9ACTN|nr:hypothetical protein [Hoyosella altamirensis]MBB3037105.1 antitoxin (DNA-binding transcriptional repressor) of toxin-antitoxin stability system [Hoyosella altamirensis]
MTTNGRAIAELIPLRRCRTVTRDQFAAGSRNAPIVDVERFRSDLSDTLADDLTDPYAD